MDERWGRDGSLIAVLDSLSPLAREAQPIIRGEWKNEAPGLLGEKRRRAGIHQVFFARRMTMTMTRPSIVSAEKRVVDSLCALGIVKRHDEALEGGQLFVR